MRNISLGGTFAHFSCFMRVQSNLRRKLGTLSNKDGDCYEDVSQKVNSHRFKLYRAYSISFKS